MVNGDRSKAAAVLDQIVRMVVAAGGAEVVALAREISTFDGASVPYSPVDDRTGAGDKAQGQGDPDWIPAPWRDEVQK